MFQDPNGKRLIPEGREGGGGAEGAFPPSAHLSGSCGAPGACVLTSARVKPAVSLPLASRGRAPLETLETLFLSLKVASRQQPALRAPG